MPADTWDSYKPTLYALLEACDPRHILEWGPGHSTDIMVNFRSVEKVVSIEHDPVYYEKMKTRIYQDLDLALVENLDDYATFPARGKKGPFDMIFVDGRNRARCLREAKALLKPGGFVLLHDADREQYQEAISEWPFKIFTDGGNTVALIADYDTHQKLNTVLSISGLAVQQGKEVSK